MVVAMVRPLDEPVEQLRGLQQHAKERAPKQHDGAPRKRGTVLTTRALTAMLQSVNAHLAGIEGDGDLADTPFADLERARTWCIEQLDRRERR